MAGTGRTTDRELLLILKTKLESIEEVVKATSERLDTFERSVITEDRIRNIERSVYDLQTSKLDKEVFGKSDHEALEQRVRTLENFRWWIIGAAGITSLLANMLSEYIFRK